MDIITDKQGKLHRRLIIPTSLQNNKNNHDPIPKSYGPLIYPTVAGVLPSQCPLRSQENQT